MPDFISEAEDNIRDRRKIVCVELAMQQHPNEAESIRSAVWETKHNPKVTQASVAFVFSQHGIGVSSNKMRRHTDGACPCDMEISGDPNA